MIYRGHVRDGIVVLDDDVRLPEGAPVNVEPVETAVSPDEAELPTLYERLKEVVGKATGLPEDFAAQHDHYIHGARKR